MSVQTPRDIGTCCNMSTGRSEAFFLDAGRAGIEVVMRKAR